MNRLYALLKHANPWTSSKARKLYKELLIALCAVIVVGLVVHTLSPYKATPVSPFYQSEQSTDYTHHRATIRLLNLSEEEITVTIHDGPETGRTLAMPAPVYTDVAIGDSIVVAKQAGTSGYTFIDHYRLPLVAIMLAVFVAIILLIGRKRGVSSIAGLIVSIGIIGVMIVPMILAGYDALWVCIGGAFLIAIFSILIAHGFRWRTYVSLACILFLLVLVAIAAEFAVGILHLSGLADENAGFLAIDDGSGGINISGLLIGGIIIATLGVLDDIVTAQVATVEELRTANKKLTIRQLYSKAMSVGGEHIASLVNTLAMVYAGTALPLILLLSSTTDSLFIFFNSEYLVTEITRTIVASTALVLAVPISSVVASVWFRRYAKIDT